MSVLPFVIVVNVHTWRLCHLMPMLFNRKVNIFVAFESIFLRWFPVIRLVNSSLPVSFAFHSIVCKTPRYHVYLKVRPIHQRIFPFSASSEQVMIFWTDFELLFIGCGHVQHYLGVVPLSPSWLALITARNFGRVTCYANMRNPQNRVPT